jgi:hypothetical protein
MYKASGEANLRANQAIKSGKMTDSPSGSGKDAGGTANTRADQKTITAATKSTPSGSENHMPAGVQTFGGETV